MRKICSDNRDHLCNWDLEFAISFAVNTPKQDLVAVGNTSKSFGAAKLTVSDDRWQNLVASLLASARVIMVVPFDRPGTLWEILEIFHGNHLSKTIFVMPPTTLWPRVKQLLMPWRHYTPSRWRNAKSKLAEHEIELPTYRRQGALLLAKGRRLEMFDTRHFNSEYLARFIGLVEQRLKEPTSDQEFSGALKTIASSYSSHRSISDYILFFSPSALAKALVIALIIRTFLFQPFSIPSGSGKPTLLVGDYLFASKYSYGYSHYSLPLSPPLFSGRIWASRPEYGDVVVFRVPKDDRTDYIKRIVGMPGDRIQMMNGVLHINGRPVKQERIDDFIETEEGIRATRVKRWRETLPNNVSYTTLDRVENGFYDTTPIYRVPAGHYFMMGDNRDNSTDSRMLKQVGYVPFENIIGPAQIIFFSLREGEHAWTWWRWPSSVRWDRVFTVVR